MSGGAEVRTQYFDSTCQTTRLSKNELARYHEFLLLKQSKVDQHSNGWHKEEKAYFPIGNM